MSSKKAYHTFEEVQKFEPEVYPETCQTSVMEFFREYSDFLSLSILSQKLHYLTEKSLKTSKLTTAFNQHSH